MIEQSHLGAWVYKQMLSELWAQTSQPSFASHPSQKEYKSLATGQTGKLFVYPRHYTW